jgi:hypothetical protein
MLTVMQAVAAAEVGAGSRSLELLAAAAAAASSQQHHE